MGGCGVLAAMNRLSYTDLASNEKALLAHTGLKPDEFDKLCRFFDEAWQGYIRYKTLEGKPRVRQAKQRTNSTLPTTEDKLLFVLFYLKTNPPPTGGGWARGLGLGLLDASAEGLLLAEPALAHPGAGPAEGPVPAGAPE